MPYRYTTAGILELTLPYPPSINHYWRNVGGRTLISRTGRQYKQEVACELRGLKPLEGELAIGVFIYPPDKRRRDIDNVLKALLDALQGSVYIDDNQIMRLAIAKQSELQNKVVVIIKGGGK